MKRFFSLYFLHNNFFYFYRKWWFLYIFLHKDLYIFLHEEQTYLDYQELLRGCKDNFQRWQNPFLTLMKDKVSRGIFFTNIIILILNECLMICLQVNWQDEEQHFKRGAFTKSKELSKEGYYSRYDLFFLKLNLIPGVRHMYKILG